MVSYTVRTVCVPSMFSYSFTERSGLYKRLEKHEWQWTILKHGHHRLQDTERGQTQKTLGTRLKMMTLNYIL